MTHSGLPCKKTTLVNVFVLVVVILVAAAIQPVDCNTLELIDRVCQTTADYRFCQVVFVQNMMTTTSDMRALAGIALDQGIQNATNSAPYARSMGYKTTDRKLQDYYQACAVSGYLFTLNGLENAQKSWEDSKYQDMVNELISVPNTQRASCEDFKPPYLVPNPLEERNRQMKILIQMVVAAANELNRGTPVSGRH